MSCTAIERFYAKTKRLENGCLEWQGWVSKDGYGHFWWNGRTHMAHRAAYQLFVGEIPYRWELDHICRYTKCVEIQHLEPVTRIENERRKPTYKGKNNGN